MSPVPADSRPDDVEASIRKRAQPGERVQPGAPSQPGEPNQPSQAGDQGEQEATFHCDLCGAPMLNRHCKLQCLRCGYQRDCSDP